MSALLMEDNPLLRLGLLRTLGNVAALGQVICAEPAELALLPRRLDDIALVVLGVPPDPQRARDLLMTARAAVSAQRLLLLGDRALPRQSPPLTQDWGMCGWLARTATPATVEAAVSQMLAGVPGPAAPARQPAAMPALREGLRGESLREARMLQLTPRQYEVLVLLSRGYPLKTVGRLLDISVTTVKSHVALLYQRLQVSSRNEAIHAARQRGARFPASRSRTRPVH
ncbi:response regulator transcription factor [Cupriavidus sp. 30B13]|uniref:helix-turn-helix transcriptional regulator n=1 Tax=Cupriavidus sp. 30B13 TaxID=3384241 RepID=UPI003B8FDED7